MAIDKMIPRFLVSDEDERLLKEGAMTDALNVTISEDGDGSEGVLKNVKGTDAAVVELGSELGLGDVTVIGQVSDPHRGYIYFFVADNTGSTEHAIYQLDAETNRYKIVFKNPWLDFQASSFVKSDVLNGDFQQNNTTQTILYFTDNIHDPRKINVERAINGDYDSLESLELDLCLNVVKAPIIEAPTFFFTSDPSIERNNFKKDFFQFATQVVYTDGEESALSPISKLAIPRSSFFDLIEEEGIGAAIFQDNVCNVNINFSAYPFTPNEVSKVNLFGRSGNNGSFFLIDSFNPFENLSRDLYSTSNIVYNSGTNIYKFYNNSAGSVINTSLFDKYYDNVPLKAKSQALSANRLFFSDYAEGFSNHDVSATITPNYAGIIGAEEEYINVVDDSADVISIDGTSVEINLVGGDAFGVGADGTTDVAFSTEVTLEFDYDPIGSFSSSQDSGNSGIPAIRFKALYDGEYEFVYSAYTGGDPTWDYLNEFDLLDVSPNPRLSLNFITTEDTSVSDLGTIVKSYLESKTLVKTYTLTQSQDVRALAATLPSQVREGYIKGVVDVHFQMDVITNHSPSEAGNGHFLISMRVKKVDLNGCVFVDGQGSQRTIASHTNALQNIFVDNTSPLDYSISSFFSSPKAEAYRRAIGKTFKRGCTYDFGVVYYDKFGRSSFVNKIGSTYIKTENETTEKGPVSVTVYFPGFQNNGPEWAERYKIVYTEKNNYESFLQYTVGGAYPVRDLSVSAIQQNSHPVDTNKKQLYLSLKTLDNYISDKNPVRNYSFTKGDKLRVISYDSDPSSAIPSEAIVYPEANDGTTEIIFDIVGVSIQGDTEETNIIHDDAQENHTIDEKYQGTFLILESPQVAAGVLNSLGTDSVKYNGFDWFSVTGNIYPGDQQAATQTNYWGRRVVVEILTPSKLVSEKPYYGAGHSRRVGGYRSNPSNNHGPSSVLEGNVYFRPVRCKTPSNIGGSWSVGNPDRWVYKTIYMESESISDAVNSEHWDKGRAYVFYDKAAETRRSNGLTYSDAYAEDVATLTLSSFNASLGNFSSLDSKFGAAEYIGNYNDDLVCLQENKLSIVPLNKNIIEYSGGSAGLAVSADVVRDVRYSSGDYGCGGHPEAVLIQDNSVYFVDASRQAVCVLTGGQLVPISDKSMSSFFEGFFRNSHTKYVSGYSPRDKTYYLTGLGGTDNKYKTIGYDAARGVWQSRYSFQPDLYSNQNNVLYSANYTSGNDIFWSHDSSAYNTFYDTEYRSTVQVVSKLSPSRVKVFNAISYEGDSPDWVMDFGMLTDLDQTSGTITTWEKKEGSYYSSMPRDGSANSTGNKLYVGDFVSVDQTTLTLSGIRLSRVPIPIGAKIQYENDDGNLIDLGVGGGELTVSSVDSNAQITLSGTSVLSSVAGKKVFVVLGSATNGDAMRGHWGKITLTNGASKKHELYCINTHVTDSKSHHSLGQ